MINTGFQLRPLDEEKTIDAPESTYSHDITIKLDANKTMEKSFDQDEKNLES